MGDRFVELAAHDHGALLAAHLGVLGAQLAGSVGADQKEIDVDGNRHPAMLSLGHDQVKLHGLPPGRENWDGGKNGIRTNATAPEVSVQ